MNRVALCIAFGAMISQAQEFRAPRALNPSNPCNTRATASAGKSETGGARPLYLLANRGAAVRVVRVPRASAGQTQIHPAGSARVFYFRKSPSAADASNERPEAALSVPPAEPGTKGAPGAATAASQAGPADSLFSNFQSRFKPVSRHAAHGAPPAGPLVFNLTEVSDPCRAFPRMVYVPRVRQ